MENRARSLAKAITFRIGATLITILLVFLFTGSLVISTAVGSLEFILKIFFYYLHERIWNLFSFGRKTLTVDLTTRAVSIKNTPTTSHEEYDDNKQKST